MPEFIKNIPPECWSVLGLAALGGAYFNYLRRHRGQPGGEQCWGAPSRTGGATASDNTPDSGLTDYEQVARTLEAYKEYDFNGLNWVRRPDVALDLAAKYLGEDQD